MNKVSIKSLIWWGFLVGAVTTVLGVGIGLIFPNFDIMDLILPIRILFWCALILFTYSLCWGIRAIIAKAKKKEVLKWFLWTMITASAFFTVIIQAVIYSFICDRFDSPFVVGMSAVWGAFGIISDIAEKQKEKNEKIDKKESKQKTKKKKSKHKK